MARVHVPDTNQDITDPKEIGEFLTPFGINFEQWDVEGRIGPDATNEEILDAYSPEIERLKTAHGFVTADVINVCLLYTSPSPRDRTRSRMPSSA